MLHRASRPSPPRTLLRKGEAPQAGGIAGTSPPHDRGVGPVVEELFPEDPGRQEAPGRGGGEARPRDQQVDPEDPVVAGDDGRAETAGGVQAGPVIGNRVTRLSGGKSSFVSVAAAHSRI